MTQPPPPPPNEPPQGGFGAPQDPPPGGFGPPVPPPQNQPPYGYPPQVPPAAGPGYGYPGQQPPGYGHPGQQPPAYGYPTQPMQPHPSPYPPPPRGGGRKLSAQARIIIAATVAVALIIVGGVYTAYSGDDQKKDETRGGTSGADGGKGGEKSGGGAEKVPADVRSRVAFQVPTPKVDDLTGVAGSWLTDTTYVKTGVDKIVGYDPDKGTARWTIPLPGHVCAASRHVGGNNLTAVAFAAKRTTAKEKYQPCTEIGGIDLASGRLLWTKSITGPNAGDRKRYFNEITVGAGTVAVGGTDGGAALDLATGTVRWKPLTSAEDCRDMGYAGGDALAVVRTCGPYDDPQLSIDSLNPTTGAPLSSYKMPPGVDYASIVSTKPLVVAADVGDTAGDGSGISDFFSIDEKTGRLRAKIAADADVYGADCQATEVESCVGIVIGNGRLYLPTEEHDGKGEYGQTNEIVSFDLATGKTTADRAEAGERRTITPLRMDGDNILAYTYPPYDKGGQIISIDGSTFKRTVLMENPSDKATREGETSFGRGHTEIHYRDGRLFFSDVLLSKPSALGLKSYLVMAFSTR